jgi:hypothetical protein
MMKHKKQMAHYTGVALTSEMCRTLLSKKFPIQAPAYVLKGKHTCHSLLA